MATSRALGASSPTRMVPRPGVIPARRSRATRSVTSARTLAASSSPSSSAAVMADPPWPQYGRARSHPTGFDVAPRGSMAEVALAAGHDHGETGLVGGGDDLAVPDRTAGLHHRGHPGLGQPQQPGGEGEEGVAG